MSHQEPMCLPGRSSTGGGGTSGFLVYLILGASEWLFEEISVVGGIENENEKVRLNMFCQQ